MITVDGNKLQELLYSAAIRLSLFYITDVFYIQVNVSVGILQRFSMAERKTVNYM